MFYAIYTKNDFLLGVFDTLKEVACFLKISLNVLYSRVSRTKSKDFINMKNVNIYKIEE